jgi:hypothetical protein
MKKATKALFFLLIGMAFSAYQLRAQPTLTNSVFLSIGQEYINTQADTTGVEAGPAGANLTWDFSGLSPLSGSSNDTTTYVAPGTTPYAMDFPDANLAGKLFSGDFYTFFKKETNRFSYLGAAADSVLIVYSDPDILLETPLSYTGSFSDSYEAVLMDTMATLIMSGDKTSTYDAYGTLMLPSGTISNAMRMKTVEESRDSAAFPGGYILTVVMETEYNWFVGGMGGPLLTIGYREGSSTIFVPPAPPFVNPIPRSKTVTYLQSGTTGLEHLEKAGAGISIEQLSPNPAAAILRITVEAAESFPDSKLRITNSAGRVVYRQENALVQGENTFSVPVASFPAGAYWLTVHTKNGLQTAAWIKQ